MITSIKNELEYKNALQQAGKLVAMDPAHDTKEGDELVLLARLIGKYENEHFPIEPPDAITAIQFRMEQQGLEQKDLAPFIGSLDKVADVLNGKRRLTLKMIRALHNRLGIPLDVLRNEK